jgi:hypothetical protein
MALCVLPRTRAVRALVCCALMLIAIAFARPSVAGDDPRAVAGDRYARGIELANQGRFQAALDQFEAAYALSPHFAVLYNIGQARIALGQPHEAIEALSRYLRDGAAEVPPGRREQVQAQLTHLSAMTAAEEQPAAPPAVAPAPVLPGPPAPHAALVPDRAPPPPPAAPRATGLRRAAYALAAAGLLSATAALGVYVWYRGEYDEWRTTNAILTGQTVRPSDYHQRIVANNQRAATLVRANHAIVGLSIAGGVLFAAGLSLFLVDRAQSRRGGGEISLAWDGRSSAAVTWSRSW